MASLNCSMKSTIAVFEEERGKEGKDKKKKVRKDEGKKNWSWSSWTYKPHWSQTESWRGRPSVLPGYISIGEIEREEKLFPTLFSSFSLHCPRGAKWESNDQNITHGLQRVKEIARWGWGRGEKWCGQHYNNIISKHAEGRLLAKGNLQVEV